MKNFTISYQVEFIYENEEENVSRLIDITLQSKNLHSLQKILIDHSVEDDVERNDSAISKVIDIISQHYLIVDHKGKQVWKDWNFQISQ